MPISLDACGCKYSVGGSSNTKAKGTVELSTSYVNEVMHYPVVGCYIWNLLKLALLRAPILTEYEDGEMLLRVGHEVFN
jgi:hypothetical protein